MGLQIRTQILNTYTMNTSFIEERCNLEEIGITFHNLVYIKEE
jgi:hypothetical protein